MCFSRLFTEQRRCVIYILGAGIAGLTLAASLERRSRPWRIFEKAGQVGEEASGKNAGILRTYETDPVIAPFARQSLGYYRAAEPSYRECGLVLKPWEVDYAAKPGASRKFSHGRFSGIFLPENGTLEPMQLLTRLVSAQVKYGGISPGEEARLEAAGEHVTLLSTGTSNTELSPGDYVVVACGEGAKAIARSLGRAPGLVAHRRTLFEFKNPLAADGPVEWDEESGVYFRLSGGGQTLTATAGEQVPVSPQDSAAEDEEKLMAILIREFPFLSRDILVSTRTCKRLTPLDNRPFAGRDGVLKNLFWFTGLGGRGISIAPAVAEVLADLLCGKDVASCLAAFAPDRMEV